MKEVTTTQMTVDKCNRVAAKGIKPGDDPHREGTPASRSRGPTPGDSQEGTTTVHTNATRR